MIIHSIAQSDSMISRCLFNLHAEKGGLGGADTLADGAHLGLREDFDAATSDFRGNIQGLYCVKGGMNGGRNE